MTDRRNFIRASLAAPAVLVSSSTAGRAASPAPARLSPPLVLSTWDFGVVANQAAWSVLSAGGSALDAVEAGARIPEADLSNHSVGRAGYPDRDGHVTLDASIMDYTGACGAVAGMENIAHPISVARRVMERTPHVLLVGDGATQFAVAQGFPEERLLTAESESAWREWLKTASYKPRPNSERGDYGHGGLEPPEGRRTTTPSACWRSTKRAISLAPAPPAAWPGNSTAGSETVP